MQWNFSDLKNPRFIFESGFKSRAGYNGARTVYVFLNFSNKVLDISSGIDDVGGLRWELVAYLALAWITVYFVVWKGLHNSGKVIIETF